MKLTHKGQGYRKWRVIKFRREQAARRLPSILDEGVDTSKFIIHYTPMWLEQMLEEHKSAERSAGG